jgi:hypothetical protein
MNQELYTFASTYARYEYTLKALKFAKMRGNIIVIKKDQFIESIATKLDSKSDLISDEVCYYLSRPPQRQIIENNCLKWVPIETKAFSDVTEKWKYIFKLVDAVRNNLFHGGKAMDNDIESMERNVLLFKNGSSLIRHAISCDSTAKNEYNSNIQFDLEAIP